MHVSDFLLDTLYLLGEKETLILIDRCVWNVHSNVTNFNLNQYLLFSINEMQLQRVCYAIVKLNLEGPANVKV